MGLGALDPERIQFEGAPSKRNIQNHPKQHSGEANKRVGVLMLHQVIAIVFSDVSARVIGLSEMSPLPQQPQSTGSPARHLLLPVPFLLSLTLPPPSHLLGYSTSPSLSSSPSTPPNRPTATRALAAAWSVILQVVTSPAADARFCLLVTAFFIELGR